MVNAYSNSVENNRRLAWHSVVSHLASHIYSVNGFILLHHDADVLDGGHVLEQELLVALDELLLAEGHGEQEGLLLAELGSLLEDEGGKLHGETSLLLVSDSRAHLCDVLITLNCAILFPVLRLQDLKDLLLELGELGADSNDAALLGCLRLSRSSLTLALLLSATLLGLLQREANLTLDAFKVLQLGGKMNVEGFGLGPTVIHQEVCRGLGHACALLEHGKDGRLPDVLAEVRRDRVHDRQDSLDVASNDERVLLTTASDQIALLNAQQLVEDDDDAAVLHLSIGLLGFTHSTADLIRKQVVPQSVLRGIILGKVQRLLSEVGLNPLLQDKNLHDIGVSHGLVKVGIVEGVTRVSEGDTGCIRAKLLDALGQGHEVTR